MTMYVRIMRVCQAVVYSHGVSMARIGFKLELCCCCECVGLSVLLFLNFNIPCGVLPAQLALVGTGLDCNFIVGVCFFTVLLCSLKHISKDTDGFSVVNKPQSLYCTS